MTRVRLRPLWQAAAMPLAALAVGLLAACASAAPDAPRPALAASPTVPVATPDPTAAREALAAAIGGAACSSDAQCRTVAVGAKACGGPAAYCPWSMQTAQAPRIQALADQYTQALAAAAPPGRVSTCSVVTDPGAACVQQRCVLRTGLALK